MLLTWRIRPVHSLCERVYRVYPKENVLKWWMPGVENESDENLRSTCFRFFFAQVERLTIRKNGSVIKTAAMKLYMTRASTKSNQNGREDLSASSIKKRLERRKSSQPRGNYTGTEESGNYEASSECDAPTREIESAYLGLAMTGRENIRRRWNEKRRIFLRGTWLGENDEEA